MDKPNIKIIFVDLDWTLFDHNILDYIPSGLDALARAREKGVKVIICTSRCYASLLRVDAFNKIPHDGYICNNGGIAFTDNRYIYHHHLDKDLVKTLLNEFKERNYVAQITCQRKAYLSKPEDDMSKIYYDNWLECRPTPKEYEDEEVTSMLLFLKEGDESFLNSYNVTIHRFFEFGIDITPFPYLKKEGVEAVLNYYGYSKDNASAFGDDLADIDMFNSVTYSVAMGNGKPEAKEAAYMVTEPLYEDGLLKALIRLGVLDE